MILNLSLEVHQTLQLTPTCKEYNMSLIQLTDLYKDKNQLENAIQLRLEAYQLLLAHLDSSNFIRNVNGLAECYEAMGHNEAAEELRLKVRQLILAGPPIYLLQRNLVSLSKFGHNNLWYSEMLLELYHLSSGNKTISSDHERICGEKGDVKSMIRLLLKCVELGKTLAPYFNPVVNIIGDLYLQLGEKETAIQLYVQTLHYWLKRRAFGRTSEIIRLLDEIFEEMGQPNRSAEVRESALYVYEKHGIVEECHYTLRYLASFYAKSGQRNKQITVTLKVLHNLLLSLCSPYEIFEALENTVRLYRELGEVGRIEPLCTLHQNWKDQVRWKSTTELWLLHSSEHLD